VEVIHGLVGMRCGGEDGALVVLDYLQPACDIGGMIVAHFWCDPEIRAEERAGKLGHQFLAGIAFVAPGLAAEAAIVQGSVARPVRRFMCQRRIETLGITEGLDDRHLNIIAVDAVVSAIAAVADVGFRGSKECLGVRDALDNGVLHFQLSVVVLGQAVNSAQR